MIKSSNLTLNFSTESKLQKLDRVLEEYSKIVNLYIEKYYKDQILKKYCDIKVDTWLSARMLQTAGKHALQIIKSTRKKQKNQVFNRYKKIYAICKEKNRFQKFTDKKFSELNLTFKKKPYYDGKTIELDNRFISLKESKNSFDNWVHFQSIGNKIILDLPVKKHKHFNTLKNWKMLSGCRICKNKKGFYISFNFEKESPKIIKKENILALDLGINTLISTSEGEQFGTDFKDLLIKLNRKKQKSKAFDRCLNEIKNKIGYEINKLKFNEISDLILEDLKYIQLNTKGRVNKTTRKYLSKWNLGLIRERIRQRCEENCVYLHFVSPRHTSRTCPECNSVDKRNRSGTKFSCRSCGYSADADLNAAQNILQRFRQEKEAKVSNIASDSQEINLIKNE